MSDDLEPDEATEDVTTADLVFQFIRIVCGAVIFCMLLLIVLAVMPDHLTLPTHH